MNFSIKIELNGRTDRGGGMESGSNLLNQARINGKKNKTPHMKLQLRCPHHTHIYMTVAQPSTANIPLFCMYYLLSCNN